MSTEGLGWGVIQQNFPDASWTESSANRPISLQVESWDKQPSSGNWGTDKPSAPSPSENHLSARKTVQGSWGPNKSENSWNKNESVQVDQSNWRTRKEEPAISASEYKNKRDDEIDAGIERSFESYRNDDYDRPIVLDEDDYDSRYNSFSTSNKPQLGKLISTPYEEIPFNTSEAYDAKSRVEPFITSSNSTFQELPNKEYRDVEVQTDPIDISKLIASNEKLLSCTISSPIKKEYQRSNSATSSVSEKRYPPQQISLLDADLEEYTSTTTPKPNSDSWDSKPTSIQNNSWNAAQQTSVRNENRGPVPQTIPVTPDSRDGPQQPPARNDNRGSVPQMVPVTSDSWDGPQQPPARNENRGPVPQMIPVTSDSWDGPQQPPSRNENRGSVPQMVPVTSDSWDGPQQPPVRNDNRDPVPQSTPLPQASAKKDNSGTVPQQIPVEPDSWDSAPQTTAKNNRGSDFQPIPSWSTVSQPMQNNSWDSGPQKPSSQGDAASRPSDPTSDWTKKAEMFAKELGESSEIKVWEPTSNVGLKAEDSYGTGASDSYHDNSSSNNRNCRSCGQEGHYARDCPNKKQGGCHKCGKEGHFARECPEESGYGGGREYGGGKSCHKCGKEGHFARECPEESSRSGYGGGRSCHKCGKEGHFARECPEESSRSGYGGSRSCHKCGKEGHFARDCREDAYETTGEDGSYGGRRMSREFSSSSMSRPYTKTSPFSNPEPSDISSEEAWTKLLKASDELDVEDFKEALELYAKANPEETFVSIERKLRNANCNGRIIALERPEIPLTKVLVDLQGNTNKKYVARPIMCHPSRLPRTSGKRADSEEENLEWLADAGFMVDDYSPVCFNCKQKGHITKDCTEPKREIEKPSYLTCQNCKSSDHVTKFCPEERRDYYVEARDRKVSGSHKGEYSANEDRASSGYDGEDDRRGYRGYGSNSSQVCHNCNREGHISRNCPEAKRSGGDGASSGYNGEDDRRGYRGYSNNSNQICHNCDREGHISKECPEPRRGGRKCNTCGKEGHISKDCTGSSGGNYDRGNYNSNGGWQRDSSSRNNDQTASRSTRDKEGDNTWNKARSDNTTLIPTLSPRENSWNNPSGGDSSRGDYYNAQNKSHNDTYGNNNNRSSSLPTQNEGRDTSRQRDNQPVIPKVESDSWDAKPKTTNTFGGNEWGSKTAEDFGWGNSNENKSSTPGDYESRRGRGNDQRERTSVPDDYDNNRRGRGNDQRERTYDDHDNNRRGRGNDQRERTYNDYDNNRRGRGNDQRERTYDDYDNNRRGRGNDQRERTYDDHDNNRRGRGNDQRERTYDNYDNRRGRGNDPRERTNKGPDHDRLSNSSRTRSNDVNNQPWW